MNNIERYERLKPFLTASQRQQIEAALRGEEAEEWATNWLKSGDEAQDDERAIITQNEDAPLVPGSQARMQIGNYWFSRGVVVDIISETPKRFRVRLPDGKIVCVAKWRLSPMREA